MKLKLQSIRPAQGMQWVQAGVRETLRRPLAYISLLMVFMMALMLASLVPLVGGPLMLLSVPLLSLAFMMATRASLNGHTPGAGVFIAPWVAAGAPFRKPLLALCVLYALLSAGAMALGEWVDGGALSELIRAVNDPDSSDAHIQELANAPGLLSGALLRIVLTVLVSVPFWHAPALVVWTGQGLAQALFSSTLALWQARWALLVYSLGWLGLGLAAMTLGSMLLAVVGGGTLGSLLLMPLGLSVTSAYYVSLLFVFQDSFVVEIRDPAA